MNMDSNLLHFDTAESFLGESKKLYGGKTTLKNMLLGKKYMGFSERLERTIVRLCKEELRHDLLPHDRAEKQGLERPFIRVSGIV